MSCLHFLDKSFIFVTATGSTDHCNNHVDPDCTADGQEEMYGEESEGLETLRSTSLICPDKQKVGEAVHNMEGRKW